MEDEVAMTLQREEVVAALGEEAKEATSHAEQRESVKSDFTQVNSQSSIAIRKSATTFASEERHLLRATPMSVILHRLAALFQNSAGSAHTYELSEEVDEIDVFASHNWVTHRLWKFLALALHFNLTCATTVAFCVTGVSFILQTSGVLPLLIDNQKYQDNPDKEPEKYGMFAHMLTTPVFLFVLFFKHDLLQRIQRGPMAFLDKTCIHQTDRALQRQGILKLGAFLKHTKCMLILYSDVYMRKLWTVYEVACFLAERTADHMVVLHLTFGVVFIIGVTWFYFAFYMNVLDFLPSGAAFVLVYPCSWFMLTITGRHGYQAQDVAWSRLQNFRVQDAMCFCEEDRPIVEGNIEAFFKSKGYTAEDAPREEGLEAFDRLVRHRVLRAMRSSPGLEVVSYGRRVIAVFLTKFAHNLDEAAGLANKHGVFDIKVLTYLLYHFIYCVAVLPVSIEVLAWFLHRFTHLSGCRNWVWASAVGLCTALPQAVFMHYQRPTVESSSSTSWLVAFVIYNSVALVSGVAVCIWRMRASTNSPHEDKDDAARRNGADSTHEDEDCAVGRDVVGVGNVTVLPSHVSSGDEGQQPELSKLSVDEDEWPLTEV